MATPAWVTRIAALAPSTRADGYVRRSADAGHIVLGEGDLATIMTRLTDANAALEAASTALDAAATALGAGEDQDDATAAKEAVDDALTALAVAP